MTTKTILAVLAVLALTTTAHAQTSTFEFEGKTWTITNSGNGAPVTGIHMTSGFDKFCPSLAIKLESVSVNTGGSAIAMTKEQKFRGDKRWHVVCDRTAAATTPPPPAATTQPAPQLQQRTFRNDPPSGMYRARYVGEEKI